MISITKYLAIKKDDKMEINYDKEASLPAPFSYS